jgi:hypothetical protein
MIKVLVTLFILQVVLIGYTQITYSTLCKQLNYIGGDWVTFKGIKQLKILVNDLNEIKKLKHLSRAYFSRVVLFYLTFVYIVFYSVIGK